MNIRDIIYLITYIGGIGAWIYVMYANVRSNKKEKKTMKIWVESIIVFSMAIAWISYSTFLIFDMLT